MLGVCADAGGVEAVGLAADLHGATCDHVTGGVHIVPLAAVLDPLAVGHRAFAIEVDPALPAPANPVFCRSQAHPPTKIDPTPPMPSKSAAGLPTALLYISDQSVLISVQPDTSHWP